MNILIFNISIRNKIFTIATKNTLNFFKTNCLKNYLDQLFLRLINSLLVLSQLTLVHN